MTTPSQPGATWTVIGAGTILPQVGLGPAGYALRGGPGAPVTLFDCGPGTVRGLAAAGIGLEEVRRVVLTHFHVDHCLDVFALAFARRNPTVAAPPLEVVGPVGLRRLFEGGRAALGRGVDDPGRTLVEVPVRAEGTELERPDVRLRGAATAHNPDALCWRAELPTGEVVAYSGDATEVDALVDVARGADLFVCECSHPDDAAEPNHLTPTAAGRLAARAGAARLLLTHFYPDVDPAAARRAAAAEFAGPIELARDGRTLAVAARAGA